MYECPNADACVGGSDSTSYCAEGFKGPRELKLNLKFNLKLKLTGRFQGSTRVELELRVKIEVEVDGKASRGDVS